MFTHQRTSLSNLLGSLIIAMLFVLGVCSPLYLREANQIAYTALDNENRRMDRFTGLFRNDIDSAVSDLRLLTSGDALQAYLLSGQPADRNRAVERALFFSKDNPDYDQVRYLDEKGQEIIRIDQNGVIIPDDQLQNKADRYYFQKANTLSAGQIYISSIDLNVERGVIEQPLKPTFRLAMPVFDAKGQRRGIYIINYLAGNSIERLREFVPRYASRFRLLNAQGYWLAAAHPEEEWGFMVPERSGMNFAKMNPALWAQVVHDPSGQVPFEGGYFTWLHAVPRDFVQGKPVTLVTDDDFLVFASQINSDEWSALFASLRQTFVVVALLLLMLTTVIVGVIQARRKAQQERDRFFNLTRDMLCVAGFDGYFKRVNPAWETALGYSSKEMRSKPFLEFVHPEDREKTIAESGRLARGGETISFENRYRCKDGSYRWLMWSARSLVEEQLIYASARDMTERKQIEESLGQSEKRSRSIIESAHDAFISIDIDGRIKDWNLQAESMFGWPRAEALGRFLHETIIPPKYRESHLRGIQHLKATGEGPVLNKTHGTYGCAEMERNFPWNLSSGLCKWEPRRPSMPLCVTSPRARVRTSTSKN
jgi:PAS domain S-box-containing protein